LGSLSVWISPVPELGDVVGLRRLYRTAVEQTRREDIPEADKRIWIAELARQYRAAGAGETGPFGKLAAGVG
jgi:hypothetical protein